MSLSPHVILCNGAELKKKKGRREPSHDPLVLDYRSKTPNINLHLPNFVQQVNYLPPRLLDLLEIAAYVYLADRLISRGGNDAVHYDSWARQIHFSIRVRDYKFWNSSVGQALSKLLVFVSGDASIELEFQPGQIDEGQLSLFSSQEFVPPSGPKTKVMLFSGGLDSLAGTLELLADPETELCPVSHYSSLPSSKRTQRNLMEAIRTKYQGRRIEHYAFECSLKNINKARDETQRTRIFLYSSIAFALASAMKLDHISIFENGVTSLNLAKRQDMNRARASRTTHPQTIALMREFFSLVHGAPFSIETPYFDKTKTDVVRKIVDLGHGDLIDSSVSCSHTRAAKRDSSHCGGCNQCVDRRFASFAAQANTFDHSGLYSHDFLSEPVRDDEMRTQIIDFFRITSEIHDLNLDAFEHQYINELADAIPYLSQPSECDPVEHIYRLLRRHADQVNDAYQNMRKAHDSVYKPRIEGSLFSLIDSREHLREPVACLADRLAAIFARSIPVAFQSYPPANEREMNDYIQSVFTGDGLGFDYKREFPSIAVAHAKAIPDHCLDKQRLLFESKLIKKGASPSRYVSEICADITEYSANAFLLFLVYDLGRRIPDIAQFQRDLEAKRSNMRVCVFR